MDTDQIPVGEATYLEEADMLECLNGPMELIAYALVGVAVITALVVLWALVSLGVLL